MPLERRILVGFLLCSAATEIGALYHILNQEIPAFLAWHGASSYLLVLCLFLKFRQKEINNLPIAITVFWTFFPIIGALFCIPIYITLKNKLSPSRETIDSITESMESEDRLFRDISMHLIAESQDQSPKQKAAENTQPFIDILQSGDLETKKRVVSYLRALKSTKAIGLLKIAQRDPQYDIQFLSTVALNAIEDNWHDQIRSLTKEIQANPEDVALRNEITSTYMLLFNSGLVPVAVAKIYLSHALEHIVMSLQFDPSQADILIQLGKIHLFLDNHSKALRSFDKALKINPNHPQYQFWRAEALFGLRRYGEVREICAKLDTVPFATKSQEILEYWRASA